MFFPFFSSGFSTWSVPEELSPSLLVRKFCSICTGSAHGFRGFEEESVYCCWGSGEKVCGCNLGGGESTTEPKMSVAGRLGCGRICCCCCPPKISIVGSSCCSSAQLICAKGFDKLSDKGAVTDVGSGKRISPLGAAVLAGGKVSPNKSNPDPDRLPLTDPVMPMPPDARSPALIPDDGSDGTVDISNKFPRPTISGRDIWDLIGLFSPNMSSTGVVAGRTEVEGGVPNMASSEEDKRFVGAGWVGGVVNVSN